MTDFEQLTILQSLLVNPSMHLHELCDEVVTGKRVYPSTICRTIHHFRMTRQKFGSIAIQRSDETRAEFMTELSLFDPSMLSWLDETRSDWRNTI